MEELLQCLNAHYAIHFDWSRSNRDMGSTSYIVYSGKKPYFLRFVKPALAATGINGVQVQQFLARRDFPVPAILPTANGSDWVEWQGGLLILYEFIEGEDVDQEEEAEAIGALTGRLHREMKDYRGELVKRDRDFYLGRYLATLERKAYPRVEAYRTMAEAIWEKAGNLSMGYCHGDLYRGNIRKGTDGKLYVHDFDTSCWGLPMYDVALICDRTDYFHFQEENFDRSQALLARFLTTYREEHPLGNEEAAAFPALIALQHFSTQATIMELFGMESFSHQDMDEQLLWLEQWNRQWMR